MPRACVGAGGSDVLEFLRYGFPYTAEYRGSMLGTPVTLATLVTADNDSRLLSIGGGGL